MTIEIFDGSNLVHNKAIVSEIIKMQKKYEVYFHEQYQMDYSWIIRQLPTDIKGLHIMDAGCGLGMLQYYLYEKGANVYGFDYLPYGKKLMKAAEKNKNNKKNKYRFEQIHLGDERSTVPWKDNYFDYIVSCSSLEHNLPAYFFNSVNNCISLLKPKGKLIMTLPFSHETIIKENMITFGIGRIENILKLIKGAKLDTDKSNLKNFFGLAGIWATMTIKYDYFVPGGIVLIKNEKMP